MKKILILISIMTIMSCKDSVSDGGSSVINRESIKDCSKNDNKAPVFTGSIQLDDKATINKSPEFSFSAATDNCEISHYEVSIGTSLGAQDIIADSDIGNVTSSTIESLNLSYSDVYYLSIKAIDKAGNKSGFISSSSFQVFTPKTLPNLVLWLDASRLDKIKDNENDDANSTDFSGDVKSWLDISESTSAHDFVKEGSGYPQYDVVTRGISFSGNQELMGTVNHPDINTAIVNQRSLSAVFKSSDNISSRQVVYEEGGTTRGINLYIENSQLHCGFWNNTNDGDGTQPYVEVSQNINQDTIYVVTLNFDYSHFVDANSAPGTIECIVNKASAGKVDTTSRLHPHGADIGIGGMNNGSFYGGGSSSGNNFYLDGHVFELLMYNKSHSDSEHDELHEILLKKWQ